MEVKNFNEGHRIGALRQMCEIGERETDKLALQAARKQWLNASENDVSKMKWANQIDVLSADKSYQGNRKSPLPSRLVNYLNAFWGTRGRD